MRYLILLQTFSIFCPSLLVCQVYSSAEGSSYFFYQQPAYPRDCQVFQQCSTNNASGVYLIKPDGYDVAFEVYCDNQVDGGGWTVFQRRHENNTVGFKRTFLEYREGFGFLCGEFWLGHKKLSFLTNQQRYQLHIDMTNSAGSSFYVTYDLFRISDEWGNYKLTSVGQYDGTADEFISQEPASTPSAPSTPTDCYDVYTSGSPDGVYTIQPTGWIGSPFEVYCNMSHGGGWTVLQRRVDGSVSFSNNWAGYKAGFGSAGQNENVWIGNEILYYMTKQRNYRLRIDVTKQDGVPWHMNYDFFRVHNETSNYRLELGTFTGNAGSYFFYQQPAYPRDCQEVLEQCSSNNASGVYSIKPDGYVEAFEVYCDNHVDGGGWTVFQRRNPENSVEFRRSFLEYRKGFGFLSNAFWLGNEKLSFLTNQKRYQLRIDMTNSAGSSFYVTYDLFRISDEWSNYKLGRVGQYDGTADTFIRECPTNTIFGPCACQGSCADPDGCHKSCTVEETCTCPAGYLLSDSDCVPQEQCSCYDPTFGVIPRNEAHFSSDCSEHCTCDEGTLRCDRNLECDRNAVCEERNNVRKCYCNEGFTGDGLICNSLATTSSPSLPTDCYDVYTSGSPDGVYTIQPTGWTGSPFEVYCNMSHGGGWTVLQRRVDGSVSFRNNWAGYKAGFGSAGPNENVWLGNEILYYMTNQRNYKLRIDVTKQDGVRWHMNYDLFLVKDENNNYRLELGSFTGNADYDYMSDHRGQDFSTHDRDNDAASYNCAYYYYNAGWWFKSCYTANLNNGYFSSYYFQLYNRDTYTNHYYLQYSQMKIRPV